MTWYEFYKNRMNPEYFDHVESRYHAFIVLIERYILSISRAKFLKNKPDPMVLECGCGIGSITKVLTKSVPADYYVSDINPDMLFLASQNLLESKNVWMFRQDILEERKLKADIIHSHGVLEHFKPSEIRKIIDNQLKCANVLIHYVPSSKYTSKSFGDENLWSKETWQLICSPDTILHFNNGYDLILIWERENGVH